MSDALAAVLTAVTTFAQAATTHDVAALQTCLAPSAVQHVRMGEAWTPLPTPAYLQLLREKKIGGEPVNLEVHEVSWMEEVATVHMTRLTPSTAFDDVLTLAHSAEGWTIVGATVVVTPVAK